MNGGVANQQEVVINELDPVIEFLGLLRIILCYQLLDRQRWSRRRVFCPANQEIVQRLLRNGLDGGIISIASIRRVVGEFLAHRRVFGANGIELVVDWDVPFLELLDRYGFGAFSVDLKQVAVSERQGKKVRMDLLCGGHVQCDKVDESPEPIASILRRRIGKHGFAAANLRELAVFGGEFPWLQCMFSVVGLGSESSESGHTSLAPIPVLGLYGDRQGVLSTDPNNELLTQKTTLYLVVKEVVCS